MTDDDRAQRGGRGPGRGGGGGDDDDDDDDPGERAGDRCRQAGDDQAGGRAAGARSTHAIILAWPAKKKKKVDLSSNNI